MSVRSMAGRRGVTLIELLIATSIVTFALLGVASMFPAALRSVIAGGELTKATMLAQAMTDIIRSEPFDLLVTRYNNLNTRTLNVSCPLDEVGTPPPYDGYTAKRWACDLHLSGARDSGQGLPGAFGQVRVECRDEAGAPAACPSRIRRVTVTVSWGDNGARSVDVVSDVARIR